jgi:nicotinate-nucleotide adenylyltransferase
VSVGVFGGTFNPIHWGHLRAAEEVAERLELERVLFVPSASPPHKPHAGIAPAKLRLAWVRNAIADNPRFAADSLEIERGGHSYSVETLREIGARLAPELPVFVIGCDAFSEIAEWREPDELLRLAHFAVMTRPPAELGSLRDWLPQSLAEAIEFAPDSRSGRHRQAGTRLRLIEISALEISSSDVRRRLRAGHSVRYLLPETIRNDVENSGVYAAA